MATIQQIYIALFERPADPGGLAYWTGITNGGADLSKLVGSLTAAPEATERFAGMTDAQVVNSVYRGLFGRDADSAGINYWVERLVTGQATLETIAIQVADGAQGSDKTALDNKTTAANLLTFALDTPEKVAAYSGAEAVDLARFHLRNVTSDPATLPTQDNVDYAVSRQLLMPDLPNSAPEVVGEVGRLETFFITQDMASDGQVIVTNYEMSVGGKSETLDLASVFAAGGRLDGFDRTYDWNSFGAHWSFITDPDRGRIAMTFDVDGVAGGDDSLTIWLVGDRGLDTFAFRDGFD